MLRKVRLTVAVVFFSLITLLFLDFTGTLHGWFAWMVKVQFVPAVLALNAGVILLLILLTLLFGRVYCSVICPLGVLQDLIARLGKMRKRFPYSYSPALSAVRYSMLGVFTLALLLGIASLVALLDPYASYGRIAANFLQPLWVWGNNLLAYLAERVDSYAFYEVDVWLKSLPTFIIAALVLVLIAVLAWRNGRTYCNTICPVGTVLGFLSRFSLYRVAIDADKCNRCNACARQCKSSCINTKEYSIDHSRCVSCMNCLNVCKQSAITYKLHPLTLFERKAPKLASAQQCSSLDKQAAVEVSESRRGFLTAAALTAVASTLKAQEKKVDGGLAAIQDKVVMDRATHIVPPGALSARNMTTRCTACQLCVSACPNGVLRPSTNLQRLMQPEMSYERGYCRPECNRCSQVCPAGAILPLSVEDKSSVQIGHAVWVKKNCIPLTDGAHCGNCARHCPTGAITMVLSEPDDSSSPRIPAVNVERCIGCGACEYLCPARPFSAIYVEGHERHRIV